MTIERLTKDDGPLEVGDRVSRPATYGPDRRGVVTRKYKSHPNGLREFHWLFEVQWEDTEQKESGYMRVGLTKLD